MMKSLKLYRMRFTLGRKPLPVRTRDAMNVVELINPVADTVANANYRGADVEWYIKADDIVLKNKGGQPAGNPQGQPKK